MDRELTKEETEIIAKCLRKIDSKEMRSLLYPMVYSWVINGYAGYCCKCDEVTAVRDFMTGEHMSKPYICNSCREDMK